MGNRKQGECREFCLACTAQKIASWVPGEVWMFLAALLVAGLAFLVRADRALGRAL